MRIGKIQAVALVAGAVAIAGVAVAQPRGEGWLLGAPDDTTRFEILERDAGGTGRTMLEMSIRYERMYEAVADGNLQLAARNWDGIDGSLSRGLVRRANRTDAANEFFYAIFDQVMEDFESEDLVRARAGFMTARDACMSCHVASDLAYINDQRLFRNLVFQ
jgi:hypothetical protein